MDVTARPHVGETATSRGRKIPTAVGSFWSIDSLGSGLSISHFIRVAVHRVDLPYQADSTFAAPLLNSYLRGLTQRNMSLP